MKLSLNGQDNLTLNWFSVGAGAFRGANPVSSLEGGGIIGQILLKFAISRVWGMIFCKHKSILESTQVVKFSTPTMFTKQLFQISHNKVII